MPSMWERATAAQELKDETLDVLYDLMGALEYTDFPTKNSALWQRLTTVFDELQESDDEDDEE